MDQYVRGITLLSQICGVFAAVLIAASVVIVCEMVFVRYVLNHTTIWQTDFVTFSIVAATFIGSPYLLLNRGHVNVDVLPLMVGVPTRRVLHFLGSMVALAFCILFLVAAMPWWYETWQSGQTTSTIWRARVWIPYLSVPVGLALLCLQYIAEVYLVMSRRELPFGLSADDHI